MKRIITICVAIIITASLFAQLPTNMSYQAIVRDASNKLITNQAVGMKISILQGSVSGTAVYVEIYNPNPSTNANGLVAVEIGGGVPLSGNITTIDWSAGPYFIKTETDPSGGTNYTISGTSQLLSVPYALFSKLGGFNVVKLHAQDELNLVLGGSVGPNVTGSSANIGDISNYKGLILEWRMWNRPEVFHQFIYLSDYDKDVILGNIAVPTDYPRRYTTILSDAIGTIMWLGVSLEGTQIYLSATSVANPSPRLQRIYGIL